MPSKGLRGLCKGMILGPSSGSQEQESWTETSPKLERVQEVPTAVPTGLGLQDREAQKLKPGAWQLAGPPEWCDGPICPRELELWMCGILPLMFRKLPQSDTHARRTISSVDSGFGL